MIFFAKIIVEEVLMTVTNSYNPNPLNTLDEIGLKKATSVPLGSMMGLGGAQECLLQPVQLAGPVSQQRRRMMIKRSGKNVYKEKWLNLLDVDTLCY